MMARWRWRSRKWGVSCGCRKGWKSRITWRCYSRQKWKWNGRWWLKLYLIWLRSISWRRCRGWWSYELSWFSRWHMVRSCLEWWGKILRKGWWCSNVCDFGGAVGELWKIIWCFGLKGVAVADSDWDEDDWGSGGAERRFHLGKEDGGGDLIKDDCDKYDDNDCDDCGDNTSCNVSIIYFENFMFLFSVRWRYLYNTVPFLENYLAKSSLGLGAWKSFFFIFCNSLSDNHWSH